MELARQTNAAVNIAAETEVLTYANTALREVIARVDIGTATNPLSGVGGSYYLTIYINAVLVVTAGPVTIAAGRLEGIAISRAIPLDAGDTVSLRVTGLTGDNAVDVTASLRDATPTTVTDITGAGQVIVDHNYGGTDALAYLTTNSAGIATAIVKAYRKADWDAARRTQEFLQGQTITDSNGRWVTPFLLDPGIYTILYYKQGAFGPDLKVVTVS